MKNLRPGVSRLRAELEAATGGSVAEVTGASAGTAPPTERVCVGTEAVLHQLERADLVAFLDFDAELLASSSVVTRSCKNKGSNLILGHIYD